MVSIFIVALGVPAATLVESLLDLTETGAEPHFEVGDEAEGVCVFGGDDANSGARFVDVFVGLKDEGAEVGVVVVVLVLVDGCSCSGGGDYSVAVRVVLLVYDAAYTRALTCWLGCGYRC